MCLAKIENRLKRTPQPVSGQTPNQLAYDNLMTLRPLEKDEVFISVVFHIASRIAVYFIEQFSGQHLLRRNFIAGILQIIMLRFMHMLKIRNTSVVNNTYEPQDTTVYIGDGGSFELHIGTKRD